MFNVLPGKIVFVQKVYKQIERRLYVIPPTLVTSSAWIQRRKHEVSSEDAQPLLFHMVSFLIAEMLWNVIIYEKDVICVIMADHDVLLFDVIVDIVVLV